jgi:hypothetical protein
MPIGIKLKDGSVWTAISYDVVPEAVTKTTSETQLSDITDLTCVKWDKDLTHTHPYSACFSECIWEDFKPDDSRIEKISLDVFDLID